MDHMLYVAMSGASQTMLAEAANDNNLANADTIGFRADIEASRSMPVYGPGYPTRVYAMQERAGVDFKPGIIQSTGRPLDVAINGSGFIAVQAPDGSEAYTRAGNLQVTANGILTTGAGYPVIGNSGPIAIPPSQKITIGSDGTISVLPAGETPEAMAVIDRIKLVDPPVGSLIKGSDGLIRMQNGSSAPADANVKLVTGSIESSNVNVVDAMVNMISLARKFEMQIKMMHTTQQDDTSAAQLMIL
ncbi:MAG: flagellar basal-body rod protein FlgF [Acidiferrobacterales bacterium]